MSAKSASKSKKKKQSLKSHSNARAREVKRAQIKEPLLDTTARHDIIGVVFIILAVIFFVIAVFPGNAFLVTYIAFALRYIFGLGLYFFPLVLLVIGVGFFLPKKVDVKPLRLSVGVALLFCAVLGMIATLTPVSAANNYTALFDSALLTTSGGIIGSVLAWCGLNLCGQVITIIIGIGLCVISFVIIGFSISEFVENMKEKASQARTSKEMPTQNDSGRIVYPTRNTNEFAHLPKAQNNTMLLPYEKDTKNAKRQKRRSKEPADNTVLLAPTNAGELENGAPAKTQRLTRRLAKDENSTKAKAVNAVSKEKAPSKASLSTPVSQPLPQTGFVLPPANFLNHQTGTQKVNNSHLKQTALALQQVLEDFKIMARVVDWVSGPTVTLFEIDLPSGVRVSRITGLEDDIALALAAPGVRIFSPVPGTNYVGIEVPNKKRQNVLLGDVLDKAPAGPLVMGIGKDVEGNPISLDLARMPHLLIGGTTGSGKSVSINDMIMSILMRATPAEVRLILIDPKRVEFTPYNGIPHLYVPVVTEPKEAASALSWGVAEMERRLKLFSKVGARNIGQYNAKVQSGALDEVEGADKQVPYIVIVIDELADLMMNVGKEVELSISRIAQLARAAGIHLIVATQRPSTQVVTGLIKANITNRIAFNVASGIDSRVILDTTGAENLIGLGDMLLSRPELAKPKRIQACYVTEDEINKVVEHLKEQGEPEYHSEILSTNLITLGASSPSGSGSSDDDPLLWEAADIVVGAGFGSTSNIQRRLKVGYSRAGRIMDMLEEKGIVGPPNGSKPREVLVDALELETLKAFENNDEAQS